ncbi:hypothetical protein [Microterricola viridarii]|uniref:Uncharacterized protein n=1 Tax=Microterricola viridarii TaxID=412690 RepID=A0A0X8E2R4_9MICO|nr:hypothetical protein [Microterricola viridarii]AMB58619.1 hypothetical protein AWU67_06825 [Microterricola viridarii]
MNHTNRALNRIVLFITGVLLLAIGVALVSAIVWPVGAEWWTAATKAGLSWLDDMVAASRIGATTASWIAIAALAVIVLLLAMLIVALVRLGGKRSHTALGSLGAQNSLGRVIVHDAFMSDAVKHSLGRRDEILFSSVSADAIHKTPVLHVSVTPRQNTSPRDIAQDVDRLVANLATLTGYDVPTYISIHSGLRAQLAHNQRRLT